MITDRRWVPRLTLGRDGTGGFRSEGPHLLQCVSPGRASPSLAALLLVHCSPGVLKDVLGKQLSPELGGG